MSFQQYSGFPDVLGVGGWEGYSWCIRSHPCCLWKLVQSQGIRLQGWGLAFLFPPEPLEGKVPYRFGRGGGGAQCRVRGCGQRVWSAGVVRGRGPCTLTLAQLLERGKLVGSILCVLGGGMSEEGGRESIWEEPWGRG